MSNDGFMDKAGEAANKLFGGQDQRSKDGTYEDATTRGPQDYPMGDGPMTDMTGGDAVAPSAGSHYGASTGMETRIGGAVAGDRSQYDDDPHYQETRSAHLGAFDRDYDDYRREHASADHRQSDFSTWRTARQGQRDALAMVREHMEVVGDDGVHVGTVDKVRGDEIILTRSDPAAGGVHHAIPVSWIQGVGEKLMLNRHGDDARGAWSEARSSSEEASSRALGETAQQGSDGPHILDRSFSGTYDKD